jgi:hypothetical protein
MPEDVILRSIAHRSTGGRETFARLLGGYGDQLDHLDGDTVKGWSSSS